MNQPALIESLEARQLLSATLVTSFAAHLPARLPLGGHTSVSLVVRNVGSKARGTVALNVYLSSDSALDAADPLLAATMPKSIKLNAGAAHHFSVRLTAPVSTPVGGYFLFAVAKPGNGFAVASAQSSVAISPVRINVARVPHGGHPSGDDGDDGTNDYDTSAFPGDDSSDDDDSGNSSSAAAPPDNSDSSNTDPSSGDSSSTTSTSTDDSSYDAGGSDF